MRTVGAILVVSVIAALSAGCGGSDLPDDAVQDPDVSIATAATAASADDTTNSTESADDSNDEPELLVATMVDLTLERSANTEGGMVIDQQQAQCMAERAVADHGSDRLIELGALDQELLILPWSSSEGDLVYESLRACIDLQASVAEFFAGDNALSADAVDCVAESYVESGVLRFTLFSDEPDPKIDARVDAALAAALQACS